MNIDQEEKKSTSYKTKELKSKQGRRDLGRVMKRYLNSRWGM